MPDLVREIVLGVAVLGTGLFAGLFWSFSVAVMPGLARSSDRTFVEAMQQINTAILNPVFAAVFGGTPLALLAAAALHLPVGQRHPLPWIVAALVLVAAVIAVTMGANVPRNNALGGARPQDGADTARARHRFEPGWVRWTTVRTAAATLALACAVAALLV